MQSHFRQQLLTTTLVGAFAFAFTFHTESAALRLISATVALLATLYIQQSPHVLWSWVLGTAAMLGCYCWMAAVAPVFFSVGGVSGFLIWIFFSVYEGSIFFLAHLLSRALKSFFPVSSLPLSWFVLHSVFPHIIPWGWANLFLDLKPFVLSVGVIGTPAFSLLIFLLCGPLFIRTKQAVEFAVAGLVLLVLTSSLQAKIISRREEQAAVIRIGMVQNNLDPARDFRPEKRFENVAKQRELSEQLLNEDIALLVWPESSVHFDYPSTLKRLEPTSQAHPFPGLKVPILFGTQTLLPPDAQKKLPQYYFSGLLLDSEGRVLGRYDKRILLPFAETIPFSRFIPPLKFVLPPGYELQAGTGPRVLTLPAPHEANIAMSICYEDLFSSAFADAPDRSLLLALSNDAWFLDSEASAQHYFLSRLRAVEQGKYFVRVTTNGVSAVVSPNGDELMRLPLFVAGTAAVDVPLL